MNSSKSYNEREDIENTKLVPASRINDDFTNDSSGIEPYVELVRSPQKNFNFEHVVSVFDVAEYILRKTGTLSTMKLQKLVYYCQAWSLVWDESPLFKEEIEAWVNGPVVKDLFYFHQGQFNILSVNIGNPNLLNSTQMTTVDQVLKYYGDKPAQWLIDLSHMEKPWIEARKNVSGLERGNNIIPLDSIANYYSSL